MAHVRNIKHYNLLTIAGKVSGFPWQLKLVYNLLNNSIPTKDKGSFFFQQNFLNWSKNLFVNPNESAVKW